MRDEDIPKAQLLSELKTLRAKLASLEQNSGQETGNIAGHGRIDDQIRLIDNLIGSFIYRHDIEGVFNYVSSSITKVLGYSENEFLTHFSEYLTDHRVNKKVHEYTGLSMQGIQQKPYEVQIYHKDGSVRWLEVAEVPLLENGGKVVAVEGIAHDITVRKAAEEALIRNEEKYRTLAENLPQKIFFKNKNSVYISCNESYAADLGINSTEITGKTDYDFFPEELAERYRSDDKMITETGVTQDIEEPYLHDGKQIWVHTVKTPVRDDEGDITGVLGIFWDITQQKKAEDALKSLATTFSAASEKELFNEVSMHLAKTLDVDYAFIGELIEGADRVRVLSCVGKGELIDPFEYDLADTPCANVMGQSICCYPSGVQQLFPKDYLLTEMGIEGYIGAPLFNGEGQPIGIMVLLDSKPISSVEIIENHFHIFNLRVSSEIERMRATVALRESEEKYFSLISNISSVTWISDAEGRTIFISPNIEKIYGYTSEEIYDAGEKLWFGRIHPEDVEMLVRSYDDFLKKGNPFDVEYRIKRKDGEWMWLHDKAVTSYEKNGKRYAYGVFSDITERKKAQNELQVSESRMRNIIENMPIVFFAFDQQGRFLSWNKAAERIYGYSKEEAIGASAYDLIVTPVTREATEEVIKGVFEGKIFENAEWQDRNKNGETGWRYGNSFPLFKSDGSVEFGVNLNVDITERKKTERALQKEYELNRTLIHSSPAYFVAIDADGKTLMMNDVMLKKVGYTSDEIIGSNYLSVFVPESERQGLSETFNRLVSAGESTLNENHVIARDGSMFFVEWHGRTVFKDNGDIDYFFGYGIDITERKSLESKLIQTQKMESIGTLAGGIAHDFNNILNAIMGFTYLCRLKIPGESEAYPYLDRISEATNRAVDLVRQILTFSRMGTEEFHPVLIAPIVKEALKLLRASIPTTIEINQNIGSLRYIFADSVQIHQVVMNLCTNAYHAMQDTGGTINVDLQDVNIEPEYAEQHIDMKPGLHARLTISDTGQGIDPSVVERVFEPYFTTKEKGKGTGLGLSVVHGIVKNCGGTIQVFSEISKGTTFVINLPVIERQEKEALKKQEVVFKGSGTVLFVDDEKAIGIIVKEVLERAGYTVLAETESTRALEIFKSDPSGIDVVFTDMTMPKMNGLRLSKEILAIRPDTPIIMATGYSEGINEEVVKEAGIRELLIKPVTAEKLSQAIKRAVKTGDELE